VVQKREELIEIDTTEGGMNRKWYSRGRDGLKVVEQKEGWIERDRSEGGLD
jgi:hypothetical protein